MLIIWSACCSTRWTLRRFIRYKALELVTKEAGDITDEFVRENSEMEWRKIAGLRSIIRHDVNEIDNDIIVDIVETRLPSLIEYLKKLSK